MEIESSIPFYTELQDLIENREFKRTLILWLKFLKSYTNKEIANFSGESLQNVKNAIVKWETQGTIEDKPRHGRPPEFSIELEETIIVKQMEDRFKPAIEIFRELNTEGCEVSYDKVKRVIRETFIKSSAPLRIRISEENKAKRLLWIENHTKWRKPKSSKGKALREDSTR